jgi:tRNA-dihydrouridine synthase A
MCDNLKKSQKQRSRRFSIAPMMEWTDRHCRFFHRLLTRKTLIYTEMLTVGAVLHGDRARLLGFDPFEHPVALQLGGSEPAALAASARIGEEFGYNEINLNVGCPSDRVQEGRFGACLMMEPTLVAECVAAMKATVKIPVTVKCRLGVDEQDPEQALFSFTEAIEAGGADALIVHARKAWLKGLSPRENREVPPLDYTIVHRLKRAHPDFSIVLNGGIASLEQAKEQLAHVDGVMMGRAAYQEPWRLLAADPLLFGESAPFPSSKDAALALVPYIERQLAKGVRLHAITRHVLGLFRSVPGARAFRRHLATEGVKPEASASVMADALAKVLDLKPELSNIAAA